MNTLLIAVLTGVAFLIAYHTYGRWLGGKIFRLSADAVCPSKRLEDGTDYVPTAKAVVFGHHFASIAGTGPIVGPAIAVMWGWVPALLWVVLGSIFIGAVHDFGALVVSLRNNGQTVGDIAGRVLNRRVRLLFLFVLFLALTIILAIFGLVIAAVFKRYPASIFPCTIQIPIAVAIGMYLHRRGVGLFWPSFVTLLLMYVSVIYGNVGVLGVINSWMASWPLIVWVMALLIYSYVASVLPVWTLLQPRDYINSLQLLGSLGLVVLGLVVAAMIGGAPPVDGAARPALAIAAPAWDFQPSEAPYIFPFLFITIACGSISGFHCLVSSGTSSKQLKCEPDARFVGYGAMLTEGFLATIVILACVAGLGLGISDPGVGAGAGGHLLMGHEAWVDRYSSWAAAGSLGAKVGAFVDGAANFLKALSIPAGVAIALMGVLVASFAGTTLDTACRLQRYVIQEIAAALLPKSTDILDRCYECGADLAGNISGSCPQCSLSVEESRARYIRDQHVHPPLTANPITWLRNKHGATLFAVTIATIMAALPVPGKEWSWANAGSGGLILWPMFGVTNQLLAGLSFLVIAFYLWRRRKPIWFLILPLIFMLIMPAWAMLLYLPDWIHADTRNWALIFIAISTLVLEAWMIVEAVLLFPKVRGMLEADAEKMDPTVSPGGVCC